MKIRNKIWTLLIIFILSSTMLYVVFIKNHNYNIALEGRAAIPFNTPSIKTIYTKEFQDNFETAYKDQIVGREIFFKVNARINNLLNYISSRNHNPYTLYKIGDNVYRFDAAKDYLMEFPIIYGKDQEANILKVTQNINDLSSKYNDVNFYVYLSFRFNNVDWFDKDNNFKSYGIYYRNFFRDSLSKDVQYCSYYPNDIEEYKKYFYKTDPHWNSYGSYELGYKSIVDMFNKNYNDLEYLIPSGEHVYDNFEYYGQYGRESLYLTSPDTFVDLKFDMPNYTTIVDGNVEQYDHAQEFENNTIDDYMWPFIYNYIHGNDAAEVIYDFDNNNERVLLAFVDSYASPIKYLIASHFDKAIFIDLRIYPNFDIDEYINKYGVTDVLYLEFNGTIYSPDYIINID